MFEIIAVIAAVLAVAIAVVLILAAIKPGTFSVQPRHRVRGARRKRFFRLIADFHRCGKLVAHTRTRIPR